MARFISIAPKRRRAKGAGMTVSLVFVVLRFPPSIQRVQCMMQDPLLRGQEGGRRRGQRHEELLVRPGTSVQAPKYSTPLPKTPCLAKSPRWIPPVLNTHNAYADIHIITGHAQTVPLMLKPRISCSTSSTLASKCPSAYCSLVSASRNCCTCAIRLYASAQKRSWILTSASKLGSK